LGPDTDTAGSISADGQLGTSAGQTKVLFDGIAAPMFSASSFQVTVQVPWEVAGKASVVVQNFYRDVPSNPLTLSVVDAFPGLFTTLGSQDLLALNQDGTLNSINQPAVAGSYVALFGSGFGTTSPAGITGRVAGPPLKFLATPPTVRVSGVDVEVQYAGDAPGLVGVSQINIRIPASLAAAEARQVSVIATSGTRATPAMRLWVK
jgi:uncharacterized protein (TIGR03437 family)